MEEKKKENVGLIIFLVVVVILFIPIIVDYVNKQNISKLDSTSISEKIKNDESFIVYVGELSKNEKKGLKEVRDLSNNIETPATSKADRSSIR